jgi:hypothetical protein
MNAPVNTTAPFKLVLSVGTQVVSRVDCNTTAGEAACLKGAVEVINTNCCQDAALGVVYRDELAIMR